MKKNESNRKSNEAAINNKLELLTSKQEDHSNHIGVLQHKTDKAAEKIEQGGWEIYWDLKPVAYSRDLFCFQNPLNKMHKFVLCH